MLGAACMASEEADCRLSADEGELVVNIVSQLGVALESVCRYDDARFLADSDALTGLANRRSITDRLDQEIARSERSGSTFAVVMMDVDNFKHFNDRHGHAAGDQVLAVTARALTQALRVGDMVGRFGGDEFVAILPDTDSVGAGYVLDRIEKCLEDRHFHVEPGTELLLRVSCGVAIYPRDGNESQSLLDVADAEMYRSKRQTPDRMSSAPA
jgi:diguanylate cyclase (GGDEF)-like protein